MQLLSLIRSYFQPISHESMETKHPPSTEADRCRFRLAALRFKENCGVLDLCEDIHIDTMDHEMMTKLKIERDIAFINQVIACTRSKLGKLIGHFDDLMAELNSRTENQEKLDYLRGQVRLLKETVPAVSEFWSLEDKELDLNYQLRIAQQLLVAAREENAELKMIEKEKGRSRRVVSVAVPVTIVAVATAITAITVLKRRS